MSDRFEQVLDHPITLFTALVAERLNDPQPRDIIAQAFIDHQEGRLGQDGGVADILPGVGRGRGSNVDIAHILISCILVVFGQDIQAALRPGAVEAIEFSQQKIEQLIDLVAEQTGDTTPDQRETIRLAIEEAAERARKLKKS
jgi:hypothetical protein